MLAVALPLLAVACQATPTAVASPSPTQTALPPSPSPSPSSAEPTPTPQPASLTCLAKPGGGPMVVIGTAIYEVTDPTHPRLLCHFANTHVHLFTLDTLAYLRPGPAKTDVVLHSMSSGNESVVASLPFPWLGDFYNPAAWAPDGSIAASWEMRYGGPDYADPTEHISLFAQGKTAELEQFPTPVADCVCRFGLAPPVLVLSPDLQYLAVGWPIGKGAVPVAVYRVSDRARIIAFDAGYTFAFWAPTGHSLLLGGQQAAARWTPETGLVELEGAAGWQFEPGPSPDGTQVAFTAYNQTSDPRSIRVFVYDAAAKKTSRLIDQLRSEALFVKPGWVWYFVEVACGATDTTCGPAATKSSGTVTAMNLATRVESRVTFNSGESPTALQSGWGAGDFWPNG
jgi:hypothetical protein